MEMLVVYILVQLLFATVNPMSITGSALTSYDPCGLGVVHFERISDKVWQGVLHLGLYRNLVEVEIEIHFEKKVKIEKASQDSTLLVKDDWHGFVMKPEGLVPKEYTFQLIIDETDENITSSNIPIVTQFSLNNVTLCNDAIKANQTVESLDIPKDDKKYDTHVCGRRSLDNTELVSVRTVARVGDWPWHVAIFVRDLYTNETSYYCGGNIISKTAVITAGHCVYKDDLLLTADKITVVAGISNHKNMSRVGQVLRAVQIILHPSYVNYLATADLAIIKVNSFRYTAYVQPICIWGPVYDKESLVGRQATVVGFGHDNNDKPSEVLRSAYIKVQSDATCLSYSPAVYTHLLNEFTFCAGPDLLNGTNPRNGDSGGGLVFPVMQADHRVSWFLRGVLSKCGVAPGHTECDPTYYVVYTDVGPHYGWIYHHSGLQFRTNVVY